MIIKIFFIYILPIIFFSLYICETNIYVSKRSVSWKDPNNWSLNRTPIISDNVIISQGSEIILFNPYNITIVNNIIIENGCIFYSYSVLEISSTMINRGTFITSFALISEELILLNGKIWIIDGYITVKKQLNIGLNDSIIMGPCIYNICGTYIYSNVVNNGTIIIFPNIIGITNNYTQTDSGKLYLQYNRTINSVGSLIGRYLHISGNVYITPIECIKTPKYDCVVILSSAKKYLKVKHNPQNNCTKIKKYIISDNTDMAICF